MRIANNILTSGIVSAMQCMSNTVPAEDIYNAMYVMLMGFYKLNTPDPRGKHYLMLTLRACVNQSWRKNELLPLWLAHWNKLYPDKQRTA